ncbi:MAG TPA: type IV pilin protein [Burkholderiales bacterium]|nr:type IV pilin protein [Burkholderiales bacterium]
MPRKRTVAGFTLIELLVVVAIVAILVAVALPSYLEHVRKAKRAEGKTALLKALQLEEREYTSAGTYTTDLGRLFGIGNGNPVRSGEDPTTGNYDLVAAVDPTNGNDLAQGVMITATPRSAVFTDPDCGNLVLRSTGKREFTGTSPKATMDYCW